MATARRIDVRTQPSEEIRLAQDVLRSILLAEDLRDDPAMLEAVTVRLSELEVEMGVLAGRQQQFEMWIKSDGLFT
jgi:hypothetical protein